ncbi:3-oxoacyl-[acyl-carrier protein] reductase [Caldalkalibacillus uzonensis]|uniref:3-oxoacyl-[acyl-carrier protein] reductase n=1 Tax=Caldalkalibacillus uzonensis TaxID=353224 RepID=A0ABU0CUC2_9BACI|nr:3-oxoacyl-ACP reductase family protein [Caldalkalibacillus uzonensis]MDQ0339950.1 3-oxoacyl-[acyl-carrier protein] reductase [Caldalkalibacillus uzonensis]
MHRLDGKVALVTGASSGIGKAIALLMGERGAKVAVNYHSNEQSANEVAESIRDKGGTAMVVQADVTDRDAVRQMVDRVIRQFGQIDILINNAGSVLKRSTFLDCSDDLWQQTIDLNINSLFYCCQEVIPFMVRQGGGKIINMSSVAARLGGGGDSIHYAMAKGAVNTMTVGLAKEFAPHNILVNAVAPGVIDTPFQAKYSSPERIERAIKSNLIKRLGTAEEVAELVCFLVSDAANYITGEIYTISGGR